MTSKEEEPLEDEGPSTDSAIQEERIAARRQRIQRRIETAKRDALGEGALVERDVDSEKELRKSRKQVEESFRRLVKLQSDGSELVSNVQVAVDARESSRRYEDDENKRQRIEKLEAEAKAAITKFEEITSKWELSLSMDSPQHLNEMFQNQRAACDGMIEEKNKLINDLQLDLKSKDDRYVKDLRRQAEDVDLMIERMEEQVKTLLRAYREELLQIDRAFSAEREELLESQKKRRDALEKQRQDKEVEYLGSREVRVDDLDNQLQVLRTQDAEEYNIVKIKLETDVQILEQNLQQMKATYQLNQEKLEYNFQVLKKRDEENTITKSQQKRKITRLQDLLNNLKQKLKRQEKQYSDDNQSLTDDLRRITEQFKELQKKFRHFQATDNKKFNDIWMMNQQQAVELSQDLMGEDKIIHEQQLGLQWQEPALDFLESKGPPQSLKLKQRSAVDVAQEVIASGNPSRQTSAASDKSKESSGESVAMEQEHAEKEQPDDTLSTESIRQILNLLCNESGFLVESKLMKLLSPLDQEEQSLMKLDAIFSALGIDTEEDIYLLGQYFFEASRDGETEDTTLDSPDRKYSVAEIKTKLIHPNNIYKALRSFVEANREPFRLARKHSMKLGIKSARDASRDEAFWKQFQTMVTSKEEKVWDALIDGFDRYSQVLTERATLIQETDALQNQNGELRLLLRQYINSKVNQELEIPPTKVLQMEASRQ